MHVADISIALPMRNDAAVIARPPRKGMSVFCFQP